MLPISPLLPTIGSTLVAHRRVVLVAPPGAGKTTAVPLALLDAPWLAGQRIVMLEPRRLATRAAAHRMATTLRERVGETVGYRVRLDTRVGPRTRIEVVTEGVLTRMLQDDPALSGTGLVIFDEFHERSLVADTGLALTLATAELLRPDLRVLVMSATLDGAAVATLLGDAPLLTSEARAFPVFTRHQPPAAGQWIEPHVARVVREALSEETGSILVFLPGAAEIRRVADLLAGGPLPAGTTVHPLYAALSIEAQDSAIAPAPAGSRKVVLATNIAETSLTIDGIRVVVDSGLMRIPRFSPRTGMTRLETVRVTRASADQRRGRAGRLEPGSCIRCWSKADEAGLVPSTRAEILDADLAPLALDLASAGFADPAGLRWLDPPPSAAFAQARQLLALLGAIDADGRLTRHGRAMAELGTHPRLAHMLVRAREDGPAVVARAAVLVALLEERDVLRGEDGPPPADVQLRLDAVDRDADTMMLAGATIDRGAVARVRDGAAEWRRRIGEARGEKREARGEAGDDAGLLLALAYPDRVAQRRGAAGRFLLRNGRGATLPTSDPLAQAEWIVAAQLDDGGRESRIYLAATLDPADLLAHAAEQVGTFEDISWNDATESVIARRRTMLGALVLAESALARPDPDRIAAVLLERIRRRGVTALPWDESSRGMRQRLAFLHAHDASWPDVGDETLAATLEEWLAPRLTGCRSLAEIAEVNLGEALLALLPWEQRRALAERAPERIVVPSGSSIALDYADPEAPVLAVRLQEVFGLGETPRVAGVPVVMHLLSPARRPVQVTRDLASFWKTGYFDVRKDLRGRYPKHSWPEDPVAAVATRGTRRRR